MMKKLVKEELPILFSLGILVSPPLVLWILIWFYRFYQSFGEFVLRSPESNALAIFSFVGVGLSLFSILWLCNLWVDE